MATILLRGMPTTTSTGSILLYADPAPMAEQLTGNPRLSITAAGIISLGRVAQGSALLSISTSGAIKSPNAAQGHALLAFTAQGSLRSSNTLNGAALVSLSASGDVSSPNTITGAALLNFSTSGSIHQDVVIAPAATGEVTAWVVNMVTGMHSTYTNFMFNSMFRLGADYYGCDDTGIHKLTGDKDGTTPIPWSATTPLSTFGSRNVKYVQDAKVIGRSVNEFELVQTVDEQKQVTDLMALSDDRAGLHARRVKLPKGLKGTAWQFTIQGNQGAADIKTLEINPLIGKRTR